MGLILENDLKIDVKVEKILKRSLNSIPSYSPLVKIQIMGGKIRLKCKGKTLLGVVNMGYAGQIPNSGHELEIYVL